MYRRHDAAARRAVNSMCVDCRGPKHNNPGPKTPLIMSDKLSNMKGEPQLEKEP
jgi:hypothetical protein